MPFEPFLAGTIPSARRLAAEDIEVVTIGLRDIVVTTNVEPVFPERENDRRSAGIANALEKRRHVAGARFRKSSQCGGIESVNTRVHEEGLDRLLLKAYDARPVIGDDPKRDLHFVRPNRHRRIRPVFSLEGEKLPEIQSGQNVAVHDYEGSRRT